jgi:general secretion pathway protein G
MTERETCAGCGALLPPGGRFCLACYRPASDRREQSPHSHLAGQVGTTQRPDPAIVFLPDEHAAILRRRKRRKRGAIAAAISLIVLIAGAFWWSGYRRQQVQLKRIVAREEMARRELNTMADALERFRDDVGRYPVNSEGLLCLNRRPFQSKPDGSHLDAWSGPYLDGIFEVDPWGNDYVYQSNDGGSTFTLFSYGPNGESSGNITLLVTSPPVIPQ